MLNSSKEATKTSRSGSSSMEWSEKHNVLLAREVLASDPFRFRPRTVDRGKIWQEIADRLNACKTLSFNVTKRSIRDHINLLLAKYKAKMQREVKLSGVDIEDTELDIAMEEIYEKFQVAESLQESEYSASKKKTDEDRANAEDARMKACEKLGETSKRKALEAQGEECSPKPKKTRRGGKDTVDFLREKAQNDTEKREEELRWRKEQQEQQSRFYQTVLATQQQQGQMMQMMQQQSQAMLALLAKQMDKS